MPTQTQGSARASFVLLFGGLNRGPWLRSAPLAMTISLVLGILFLACGVDSAETPIHLGSLWYPVYGYDRDTGECQGGLGSAGWNDGGAPVLVTPVSGFYCFGDPVYQETTIELMTEYGLTWTLVSYNGWGDVSLDGNIEAEDFEAAHRDIVKLFERSAGRLKIALLVEPYVDLGRLDPANLTGKQKADIRNKIWTELYQLNRDTVMEWEGKPLLVQWFPMDLGQDDRFTIKTFGSSENPDEPLLEWNWYPALDKYPQIISDDGFLSFAPRFDEYFMWLQGFVTNPRRMDPFLEEDIYCKFWKIAADNRDEVKLILIYAWNAYGEQAFIEPATNGPLGSGGADGRLLLNRTRSYYQQFLEGGGISCIPTP